MSTRSEKNVQRSSGGDTNLFSMYTTSYVSQFRPLETGQLPPAKLASGFVRNSDSYVPKSHLKVVPTTSTRKPISRRLENEGFLLSSMYKTTHSRSAVHFDSDRFPSSFTPGNSGFVHNNKALIMSAPKGEADTRFRTTYSRNFESRSSRRALPANCVIGYKEETGFSRGSQPYYERPPSPQDELPRARVPHLRPERSMHNRELEARVKQSIAKTSYLPTLPLNGVEDSFPTAPPEESGFSRAGREIKLSDAPPPPNPGTMHPKTLAHIQRSDPQEYRYIFNPEGFVSTYQLQHTVPRARTAPANVSHMRSMRKSSGFVVNQMGYVPTAAAR